MLFLPNANVVNDHLRPLVKLCAGVGVSGPVSADGDVQDDVEGLVVGSRVRNFRSALLFGEPFVFGKEMVSVNIKANLAGFPFAGKNVEVRGEILSL